MPAAADRFAHCHAVLLLLTTVFFTLHEKGGYKELLDSTANRTYSLHDFSDSPLTPRTQASLSSHSCLSCPVSHHPVPTRRYPAVRCADRRTGNPRLHSPQPTLPPTWQAHRRLPHLPTGHLPGVHCGVRAVVRLCSEGAGGGCDEHCCECELGVVHSAGCGVRNTAVSRHECGTEACGIVR